VELEPRVPREFSASACASTRWFYVYSAIGIKYRKRFDFTRHKTRLPDERAAPATSRDRKNGAEIRALRELTHRQDQPARRTFDFAAPSRFRDLCKSGARAYPSKREREEGKRTGRGNAWKSARGVFLAVNQRVMHRAAATALPPNRRLTFSLPPHPLTEPRHPE